MALSLTALKLMPGGSMRPFWEPETEFAGHLLPQRREVAGLEAEHPVTRRERVDQRGLPGAGARARIDDDRVRRAERRLDRLEHLPAEGRELRAAVVDGGHVH